jgi:hypothetical protein
MLLMRLTYRLISNGMLSFLVHVSILQTVSCTFNAQAWQNVGSSFTFPEFSDPTVSSKPNIGLTLSGGGDRAYVTHVGFLAGLHSMSFMDQFKYVCGSSGGSWATVVYSYYQHSQISDDVMLGEVVQPADISYDGLAIMDEYCIRGYVNDSWLLFDNVSASVFADWVDAVSVRQMSFHTHAVFMSGRYYRMYISNLQAFFDILLSLTSQVQWMISRPETLKLLPTPPSYF